MSKPNLDSTVKQMKDYIRQKKLNPAIKLSLRRGELIEALRKAGHWDTSADPPPTPKKKPSKQSKELSWQKLKKMPKFINFLKKHSGLYLTEKQKPNDYVPHDILREMNLIYLKNPNKNLATLYKDSIGKQSKKIQDEYYKRLANARRQEAFDLYEDIFKSKFKGSIPNMMKWMDEFLKVSYPIKKS